VVNCDNISANDERDPDLRANCHKACGKCKECKNGMYMCSKAKEPSAAGCELLCAISMGKNVDCNKLTEDCKKEDCKDDCGLCKGCKDGKFTCEKLVTPAACDNFCEKYKKYRFEDDSGRSIVDCGDLPGADAVMSLLCKADCAKCKDCAPTGGRFDCGEHESIKEEKKQKEKKAKEEEGRIGAGTIVGIVVIGILLLVFLLGGGLLYCFLHTKKKGVPKGDKQALLAQTAAPANPEKP